MNNAWIHFALACGILAAPDAFAKAFYACKAEMIQKADVIVAVNIAETDAPNKASHPIGASSPNLNAEGMPSKESITSRC